MNVYTIWSRKNGLGTKEFYTTRLSENELKTKLESAGRTHILIWPGNWFGLSPDNTPEPDYTYSKPLQKGKGNNG